LDKEYNFEVLTDCFVDELDKKTAHAFSLLCMLIRRRLPDELSDDLFTWLVETGIYQMNKDAGNYRLVL
jgi:hypothetical protein